MFGINRIFSKNRSPQKPLPVLAEFFERRWQERVSRKALKQIIKGKLICGGCRKRLNIEDYTPLTIKRCQHCDTPNFIPKKIKDYWLYAPVGSDANYRIFRAADETDFDTDVLVKILPENRDDDEALIAMLKREILVGFRIGEHPHFVKILDYGYYQDQYFVVTENVDGVRLDMIADPSQRLPQRLIMLWALQILKAEKHLYGQGYLYRNLRPRNIVVDRNGNVKLDNYYLAESAQCQEHDQDQMRQQRVASFIHYLSPERIMGEKESQSSEIYSLGMLLYRIMTHNHYFQDGSKTRIAHQHVSPLRMENLLPKMPAGTNRELIRIINKMVRHSPEERYQNYHELGSDLFRLFGKQTFVA